VIERNTVQMGVVFMNGEEVSPMEMGTLFCGRRATQWNDDGMSVWVIVTEITVATGE
jgi:hypothetical protein